MAPPVIALAARAAKFRMLPKLIAWIVGLVLVAVISFAAFVTFAFAALMPGDGDGPQEEECLNSLIDSEVEYLFAIAEVVDYHNLEAGDALTLGVIAAYHNKNTNDLGLHTPTPAEESDADQQVGMFGLIPNEWDTDIMGLENPRESAELVAGVAKDIPQTAVTLATELDGTVNERAMAIITQTPVPDLSDVDKEIREELEAHLEEAYDFIYPYRGLLAADFEGDLCRPLQEKTLPTGSGSSMGAGAWGGYRNGAIPQHELCQVTTTMNPAVMRCDAAHALEQMNLAYQLKFKTPIWVTSSYRTYAQQVQVKAAKPFLAAPPGTSNHGWGLALDLGDGINNFGSPQHKWMQQNAHVYGFEHPTWAQQNGAKPEPWHWEYTKPWETDADVTALP